VTAIAAPVRTVVLAKIVARVKAASSVVRAKTARNRA
jgi:hypothetical protein